MMKGMVVITILMELKRLKFATDFDAKISDLVYMYVYTHTHAY